MPDDDADETLDGAPSSGRMPVERVDMPVYRPRRRLVRTFARSFLLAALIAAIVVLVLVLVV